MRDAFAGRRVFGDSSVGVGPVPTRARVKLPFCSFPTETTRRPVRDLSSSRAPIRERVGVAEHASAARPCDLTVVGRNACVSAPGVVVRRCSPEGAKLRHRSRPGFERARVFTPPWQKGPIKPPVIVSGKYSVFTEKIEIVNRRVEHAPRLVGASTVTLSSLCFEAHSRTGRPHPPT